MNTFETLFAEIGKRIDGFIAEKIDTILAEKLSDVRLENPTTQEVETTNVNLLDSGEDKMYVSDRGEEILKKNGICHTRQSYSSISFYFSLLEGNSRPKRIERDELFLNVLSQHIIANSRFGLSHVDLWNEIANHYSLKSRKGKVFSRSQAEGLVGFLYLEKAVPLDEAFAYIDENYTKENGYANACSIIGEVIIARSKGDLRKSVTSATRERMINFY